MRSASAAPPIRAAGIFISLLSSISWVSHSLRLKIWKEKITKDMHIYKRYSATIHAIFRFLSDFHAFDAAPAFSALLSSTQATRASAVSALIALRRDEAAR